MATNSDDKLTDLEGAALAEFARMGPTTSYAVAASFRASPSEFWSGSAGAVYPLTKRLFERGLLSGALSAQGRRGRTDYVVTDAGKAALMDWLLDGGRAAGMGFDPLRSRLIYLDMVSASEREALLAQVETWAKALAQQQIWTDRPLAQSVHEAWMRARLNFLVDVTRIVQDALPPTRG